jgi:hypothetical protein
MHKIYTEKNTDTGPIKEGAPMRPEKGPEVPKDGDYDIDKRFQSFARSILLDKVIEVQKK